MSEIRVILIPGDGAGRDVAAETQRLIKAAGVNIAWDSVDVGQKAYEATGSAVPDGAVAKIREAGLALKCHLSTPVGDGYESPNVVLRKKLDLYANVRPIQSQRGIPSRYEGVDFTIVREATEDVYSGIEHCVAPGIVQSIKVTTREACERVVRHAFRVAEREGYTKVTLAHKANIMKLADGLFLSVGQEIAASYPDIAFNSVIADNACMQLVQKPEQYGVVVMQNLFGDLLSDLSAGVVGGPSAVWGQLEGEGDLVVFEAIHGASQEGSSELNPLPLVRAALALLRHIGQEAQAKRIDDAIVETLAAGVAPADLGGNASASAFIDGVIARLA